MRDETHPSTELLRSGETCNVLAQAGRAKVLVDAEAYYGAVRTALLNARHSIHIVGWDIDSRTDLLPQEGGETASDGAPTRLKPLLNDLVRRRPQLQVRLLLWDYSLLYAADREPLPTLNLDWSTPPQVEVCLDDVLPIGACHHQKVVVVDDALAFCGGMDLTQRRWDTPDHAAVDTRRTDTAGQGYGPYHDVQMMIDGAAARALAEMVHQRWHEASCEAPVPVRPRGEPWPDGLEPDFRDVPVAVSRTMPELQERAEVREIEALYCRAIGAAEHAIYIENQYLTSQAVLRALEDRLAERKGLEVVVVGPKTSHGWLEAKSMGAGRLRFMRALLDGGFGARVRLLHPEVEAEDGNPPEAVMVHSKLMIVDDRFLTLGSANLNNRSMGFDTECNLAVEGGREAERATIREIRHRLIAEHLGCSSADVALAIEADGFIPAIDRLRDRAGRTLRDVDDADLFDDPVAEVMHKVADPERPIDLADLALDQYHGRPALSRPRRAVAGVLVVGVLAAALLLWNQTPLARFTEIEELRPYFESMAASGWTPLLVALAYLVGGMVMFPVTVLITLTAIVFPPLSAFGYAVLGIVVSAAATYGVGALTGRRFLRQVMGKRLNRISRAVGRRGLVAVIGLRVAPVAPYAFINLVAGASHIRFRDFVLGTLVGMAPGLVVLVWLGDNIGEFLKDPTPGRITLVVLAVAAWIAVGLGLQRLFDRWSRRRGETGEVR